MRKKLLSAVCTVLLLSSTQSGTALGETGRQGTGESSSPPTAPLLGDVTRTFDPPAQNWGSGHRGVDIAGSEGDTIVAALDGRVSFCGIVAGKPVVSIRHGDVSTTYEPVVCSVERDQWILAGQMIGTLQSGHSSAVGACLHWGMKRGDEYIDPLTLLGPGEIRLFSGEVMDRLRAESARLMLHGFDGRVSSDGLANPVSGQITSAFGMRLHPIFRAWRFHDGVDIASSCGTPITASAAGIVLESTYSVSYGHHVIIDHGLIGGNTTRTGYAHAEGFTVSVGDSVSMGDIIGTVGSTGTATGCHLHFQVWRGDRLTDPIPLLP